VCVSLFLLQLGKQAAPPTISADLNLLLEGIDKMTAVELKSALRDRGVVVPGPLRRIVWWWW
jgi:hypothetical protein